MIHQAHHHRDSTSNSRRLTTVDKHCIFRCDSSWFSLLATSVREVTIATDMVRVPGSHSALAGLCHVRSEFMPVLFLNSLLGDNRSERSKDRKLLVISGSGGPWALSVDEVIAIESLETLINPDDRFDDVRYAAVMGTATSHGQVVRVLDPNNLFRLAQDAMHGFWQDLVKPLNQSTTTTRSHR